LQPWLGLNEPSLVPGDDAAAPSVDPDTSASAPGVDPDVSAPATAELPDYDTRHLIGARDPLSCVYAFDVMIKVVFPALYGYRMCPDCPHCAVSDNPCIDSFGSNATPTGGAAGRADAVIGAVEAQKAEGVLHLHFFLYLQNLCQYSTLEEIGEMLRCEMVSPEAMKHYINHVRCATYPNVDLFNKERDQIEKSWPAYAEDYDLCRLPRELRTEAGAAAGEWITKYNDRLQHTLSRMNHHIHPLVDASTGVRRLLNSCKVKGKGDTCKSDFPLENLMTDEPLFVCQCIAAERLLPVRGPRSLLGTFLPARNEPWLNAAPRAWTSYAGDNGDIKFPHRMPMEASPCCRGEGSKMLIWDVQASMAAAAGYFGGYSAKMQDIGVTETKRLQQTVARKAEVEKQLPKRQDFQKYSRRLVRDLEAKGIVRTALETVNLARFCDSKDVLTAECVRTFPTVTFPASLLLKREEIETGKRTGASALAAVHHGNGNLARAFVETPFDIMYGFRGQKYEVDLLSPYEMLLHWTMIRIEAPSRYAHEVRAHWTPKGLAYGKACRIAGTKPCFQAGQ